MFWNEKGGYLYDVVNGGPPDASIRPNQVLAVSLFHTMLAPERAKIACLEVVERELLTPYGLRTLSPNDPKYRGHSAETVSSGTRSYHQGTVWPWLLGPYITAVMKVRWIRKGTEKI